MLDLRTGSSASVGGGLHVTYDSCAIDAASHAEVMRRFCRASGNIAALPEGLQGQGRRGKEQAGLEVWSNLGGSPGYQRA